MVNIGNRMRKLKTVSLNFCQKNRTDAKKIDN